jgi:PKD repeat protein
MKNACLLLLSLLIMGYASAQSTPYLPNNKNATPDFTVAPQFKAPGDSCGAYFNNYIGLSKLSLVNVLYLRTGNANFGETDFYGGVAQRFNAPQPMEISGVEFYAYDTSAAVDSVMAIAILHDWDDVNDSLGVELARDTVYVTAQEFDFILPNISVQAYFDNPVTVSDSYMILIENPTDDSIGIAVSSPANFDGAGEGLMHYYYNNPNFPSFIGSYENLSNFGAAWDFDAVLLPLVDFELQNGFTILDDQICPNVVSAGCVDYTQQAVFSDPHYSFYASTPEENITWLWGDGLQNTQLYNACHTYDMVGTYDIALRDTLRRFDFSNPLCGFERTNPIYVLDSATADFTWVNNDTWVSFTNNSTNADSVLWDFGDSTFSTTWDAFHAYDSVATYDVTLIAFGECGNDTVTISVTVDNLGIEDYDFNFSMYPNPSDNNVNVSGLVEGTKVEILNILGATVLTEVANGTTQILPTSNLSNGTYFVRVSTDYGQVTKKLMVRH